MTRRPAARASLSFYCTFQRHPHPEHHRKRLPHSSARRERRRLRRLSVAAYAEWVFPSTYWPDFGREELLEAIQEFGKRERRYGLVAEQ